MERLYPGLSSILSKPAYISRKKRQIYPYNEFRPDPHLMPEITLITGVKKILSGRNKFSTTVSESGIQTHKN